MLFEKRKITIILSFFTLVFGELVPKRLAMKNYEKIAFGSIGVIRTISIITAPFVKFLTIVTNAVSKLFGVGESDEETVTEEVAPAEGDSTAVATETEAAPAE